MGTYCTGNGREVKMRSLHERLVSRRRISHHQELILQEAGMHLGSEGSSNNKHGIKSHQSQSVNVSGEYDRAMNIANSNSDKGGASRSFSQVLFRFTVKMLEHLIFILT